MLTPQTQNFDFSKTKAYNIQHLGDILKTELYVVNLHTNHTHTQFQSNIFIFGCTMLKNGYLKVMTSLFEMQFLAFLTAVRKNK